MRGSREIRMVEGHSGPSMECVWRVDQVSPVGCTLIQITVTL
jgi:hypothetical protein